MEEGEDRDGGGGIQAIGWKKKWEGEEEREKERLREGETASATDAAEAQGEKKDRESAETEGGVGEDIDDVCSLHWWIGEGRAVGLGMCQWAWTEGAPNLWTETPEWIRCIKMAELLVRRHSVLVGSSHSAARSQCFPTSDECWMMLALVAA